MSTLNVLSLNRDRYEVFALTAATSVKELAALCVTHSPKVAVIADESREQELRDLLKQTAPKVEVRSGAQALCEVAADSACDYVMAAIVGAVGLRPALSAAQAGKRVLLANKEALVMAGQLFMHTVRDSGAELLPIDSEHNAIFQCLPAAQAGIDQSESFAGVRKIWLTASGGPFRSLPKSEWGSITPETAVKHPNWSMGPKISVDSASLMNKGLEFIEALHLFDLTPCDVDVVVHPQSVIHSMVEYIDGSFLAQLGSPDMRTPIAHALAWPERHESGVVSLDPMKMNDLQFEAPDELRFPCLRLAREAGQNLVDAPLIMNAANEVAVQLFLERAISFSDLPVVVEKTMQALVGNNDLSDPCDLELLVALDQQARNVALSKASERHHHA